MKRILSALIALSFGIMLLANCDTVEDAVKSAISDAICDDNVVTGTITGSTLNEEPAFEGCQSFINVQETGGIKTILLTLVEGSADGARTIEVTLTPWDDTVTYPVTIDLISTFGACEDGDEVCNQDCGDRVDADPDCDLCEDPEATETDGVCIDGCAESATDITGGDPDCELVETACIGYDECEEGYVCQDDGTGTDTPECVEDTSGDALVGAQATSLLTENDTVAAVGEAYGSITIDSLDFSDATAGNISGSLNITYWMEAGYSENLRVNADLDFDITDDIDSLP